MGERIFTGAQLCNGIWTIDNNLYVCQLVWIYMDILITGLDTYKCFELNGNLTDYAIWSNVETVDIFAAFFLHLGTIFGANVKIDFGALVLALWTSPNGVPLKYPLNISGCFKNLSKFWLEANQHLSQLGFRRKKFFQCIETINNTIWWSGF